MKKKQFLHIWQEPELQRQGGIRHKRPAEGTVAIAEPEHIVCVCHKRHVLCISKQLQLLCVVLQRHLPAWRNIHGRDAHTARHDEKEKEKLKTGRATLLLNPNRSLGLAWILFF